jgi:hypothetical protein
MADVVIASDDLVILGGPSSVNIQLDIGAAGERGSQIFSDVGKPTSPGISFPFPPKINDLYINLDPSDIDYLFLYQYKLDNAVLGWTKLLRLIPTTILFNPVLKFIDGEAHSSIVDPSTGLTADVKGLYFPITGTLENEDIENLDPRDLNVQYTVSSLSPTVGGIELKEINSIFTIDVLIDPVNKTYEERAGVDFGSRYLFARFKIAELFGPMLTENVNGYRKVDMVLTVAGRSEQVLDIDGVTVADTGIPSPGYLSIPSHGLSVGSRFGYLANGNDPIEGLTDQADYYVAVVVDDDNVIILSDPTDEESVISFTSSAFDGIHSIVKSGGLL